VFQRKKEYLGFLGEKNGDFTIAERRQKKKRQGSIRKIKDTERGKRQKCGTKGGNLVYARTKIQKKKRGNAVNEPIKRLGTPITPRSNLLERGGPEKLNYGEKKQEAMTNKKWGTKKPTKGEKILLDVARKDNH